MTTLLIAPSASDPLACATAKALVAHGQTVRLLAPDAANVVLDPPLEVDRWTLHELSSDARPALLVGCDALVVLDCTVTALPRDSRTLAHNAEVGVLVGEAMTQRNAPRMVRVSSASAPADAGASEWTVIRTGDIYGPGDPIVWRLLMMMRTRSVVPVVDGDPSRMQLVWYEDVARAIGMTVELSDTATRQQIDIAGPAIVTQLDLYERLARLLDRRQTPLPIPELLARYAATVAQALEGYAPGLGAHLPFWGTPQDLNPDAADTLSRLFAIQPTPLEEGLARLTSALELER